jgi:membrane-associated phospholipid phosphatase
VAFALPKAHADPTGPSIETEVRATKPPLTTEQAVAQHRLYWSDEWSRLPRYGAYLLTGASALAALSAFVFITYPTRPAWFGGILFDDAARDTLRARRPSLRDAARTASDFTLITSVLQIALVDSLILPVLDGSPDVAAELSMINAQAFAINLVISSILFKAVARARPLVADCRNDPNFDPLCKVGAYAGFPSSHTATAFTAAGLTCIHHAYLPIYSGAWDTAACIQSLTVAAATALFRVVGDRHYASDVIMGAALGFSIGYLYPWLVYYRGSLGGYHARARDSHFAVLPAPPYGIAISLVL